MVKIRNQQSSRNYEDVCGHKSLTDHGLLVSIDDSTANNWSRNHGHAHRCLENWRKLHVHKGVYSSVKRACIAQLRLDSV